MTDIATSLIVMWSSLNSDDKASRPKFWPRPQTFVLGLALISSYYVIGHFLGKIPVKFRNFFNFSGNNRKSYVVNHYLVLLHNYFWPRPWHQPPANGLDLVALGLEVLASAPRFWRGYRGGSPTAVQA